MYTAGRHCAWSHRIQLPHDECAAALALADVFDDFFGALDAISSDLERGDEVFGKIHHERSQGKLRK